MIKRRELNRWVEALVLLMLIPAGLVAALAVAVLMVVALLVIVALIAAAPGMMVAWKLSEEKEGGPDGLRRSRRSPLFRRDL